TGFGPWGNRNQLSGGPVTSAFNGFVNTIATLPACGETWTGRSTEAQAPNFVPWYMPVIVSSRITWSGNVFSGDTSAVASVRSPQQDIGASSSANTSQLGAGVVVAIFCPEH